MADLHSIVAGYATTGQGVGPMMVTKRAGIFARHGLDVEMRLMKGSVNAVRGLINEEIQFGNFAAPALIKACLLEGADLVFLTGGINQQFLMGRPGIEHRKQLSGGKIGIAHDGGLNDFLVEFVVNQLAEEGIQGMQLSTGSTSESERTMRLVKGELDAEMITPPEAITAKRQGCSFLIDFAEYGLNFALGGIAARRKYIKENEVTVRKFIRAYVEGMHRYRTDRDFTVQVQQEYSGILDRSIAEETFAITCPGMPKAPYPVVGALQKALMFMSKNIPAAAGFDPQTLIDDRFIRELDEEGFITSLYET